MPAIFWLLAMSVCACDEFRAARLIPHDSSNDSCHKTADKQGSLEPFASMLFRFSDAAPFGKTARNLGEFARFFYQVPTVSASISRIQRRLGQIKESFVWSCRGATASTPAIAPAFRAPGAVVQRIPTMSRAASFRSRCHCSSPILISVAADHSVRVFGMLSSSMSPASKSR